MAIIRKLAEEGPGIFVGRCADYVLGDYTNCINTFIYAYKDDRIRRIMKLYKLDEKQAADKVKKTDRERKNYYEAHHKRTWGSIEDNAMMFNTSLLGIDGAVDALEAIYKKWEEGGLKGLRRRAFRHLPDRHKKRVHSGMLYKNRVYSFFVLITVHRVWYNQLISVLEH